MLQVGPRPSATATTCSYLPESAFENDVSDFLAHAMYTATLATQASDTMAHMAEYPTPVMSAPATPPPRP